MIQIQKQSFLSKLADTLMIPIMYILQGNLRESPQQTHFWNNSKLSTDDIKDFTSTSVVTEVGDPKAFPRWFGPIPIFHMPIFGGWKTFTVLEPVRKDVGLWYVGWVASDVAGLSQIPLKSSVRLLTSPGSAHFFGIDTDGEHIELRIVGHGRIGKAGMFSQVPLF
jgi:hypothetical protein